MIKKLLVLLPLVILSACGGGDDGGSSSTSGNAGASGLVGAFNAPTIGANCVLTDSDNTIITSQVTDSDGMISGRGDRRRWDACAGLQYSPCQCGL